MLVNPRKQEATFLTFSVLPKQLFYKNIYRTSSNSLEYQSFLGCHWMTHILYIVYVMADLKLVSHVSHR